MQQGYSTDLTDKQWAILEPLFDELHRRGGRPCKHPRRKMLNAIFYITRTGCQWRLLPHDFPHWDTVYETFRRWEEIGFLKQIHDTLRTMLRLRAGKDPDPSAGIIDSQTIKTTEKGGPRGYDGGKKDQRPQTTYLRGHNGATPRVKSS